MGVDRPDHTNDLAKKRQLKKHIRKRSPFFCRCPKNPQRPDPMEGFEPVGVFLCAQIAIFEGSGFLGWLNLGTAVFWEFLAATSRRSRSRNVP